MLFSVILYSSAPWVQTVPTRVLCPYFFLSLPFYPRDYRLCTSTLSGTDRILQSPFWLFQHKRGVSEKTLAAICRTTFSSQNSSSSWGSMLGAQGVLQPLTCRYRHYQLPWSRPKAGLLFKDLHKNIIHFNSRIMLELMPGIRGKNVFLAGLQVLLFFLFLPVGWSRGRGSTPASCFHRRRSVASTGRLARGYLLVLWESALKSLSEQCQTGAKGKVEVIALPKGGHEKMALQQMSVTARVHLQSHLWVLIAAAPALLTTGGPGLLWRTETRNCCTSLLGFAKCVRRHKSIPHNRLRGIGLEGTEGDLCFLGRRH